MSYKPIQPIEENSEDEIMMQIQAFEVEKKDSRKQSDSFFNSIIDEGCNDLPNFSEGSKERKVTAFKPMLTETSEIEWLDVVALLDKHSIKFSIGNINSEDGGLIREHLEEEMKPVVFMSPTFYIVGYENLKKRIDLVRKYLNEKKEPVSMDITDDELKEEEENFEKNVRLVDTVVNCTSSVLKALDPRSYFGSKEFVSDNIQGDRFEVKRINPMGIRQKRVYLLTNTFLVRFDPETKVRKSTRAYSDVIKVQHDDTKVIIHYVDSTTDTLLMKKTDIPLMISILTQKLPELEVEQM